MNANSTPLLDTKLVLSELLTNFLLRCSENLPQQAKQAFDSLVPTIHHQELLVLLTSLLDGKRLLHVNDQLFISGAVEQLTKVKQDEIACISKQVADELCQPQPLILVNIVDQSEHPAFAIRICNGVGVLYLPINTIDKVTVAHEVTHCIVSTGHHFLDEALAYFIESDMADNALPEKGLPTIDYCLQVKDISDTDGMSEDEIKRIYAKGVVVIKHLLQHISPTELVKLYQRIPLLVATRKLELQLATILGAQWRQQLDQQSSSLVNDEATQQKAKEKVAIINQAYFTGNLTQMDKPLSELLQTQTNDVDVLIAVVRGLFCQLCYSHAKDPNTELELKTLCKKIEQLSPSSLEYYVSAIFYHCIDISKATSYIQIQEIASNINALFDRGLEKFPHSGELNLMKGKSLHESQEDNKDLVQVYFNKAKSDPVYGEDIAVLIENFV